MYSFIKYLLIVLILIAVLVFALLRWIIPAFVFHPVKEMTATPEDVGLDYQNLSLPTADGETIAAWYVPATANDQGLTLLFLHGNGGNLSYQVESIAFFNRLGLSVLALDYRGYGESGGKPSVKGTVEDAKAAWQWLTEQKGIPASRIIVFGRSLGGGVAAALAAETQPAALILESTFTSLHAVGKGMFPWLPGFLFFEDYLTMDNIKNLRVPLLVVHSPADEMINFSMGREIFNSYKGPKTFLQIEGSHNEGWLVDMATYEKGIRAFIVD